MAFAPEPDTSFSSLDFEGFLDAGISWDSFDSGSDGLLSSSSCTDSTGSNLFSDICGSKPLKTSRKQTHRTREELPAPVCDTVFPQPLYQLDPKNPPKDISKKRIERAQKHKVYRESKKQLLLVDAEIGAKMIQLLLRAGYSTDKLRLELAHNSVVSTREAHDLYREICDSRYAELQRE